MGKLRFKKTIIFFRKKYPFLFGVWLGLIGMVIGLLSVLGEMILAYVLAVILFGGFFLILKKLKEVRILAEANVRLIEEELKSRITGK